MDSNTTAFMDQCVDSNTSNIGVDTNPTNISHSHGLFHEEAVKCYNYINELVGLGFVFIIFMLMLARKMRELVSEPANVAREPDLEMAEMGPPSQNPRPPSQNPEPL